MDLSLLSAADPVSAAANRGLPFSKFPSTNHLCLADPSSDLYSSASAVVQISAAIFNSVARPPVKPKSNRVARRSILKRKQRTKRRSSDEDSGGDSGEDESLFGGFGGDGGRYFGGGGGGGGGGGRGWNYDGFGGQSWNDDDDESFSLFNSSPACDWLYEFVFWIVVPSCTHFAFKRLARIMADGSGNAGRD